MNERTKKALAWLVGIAVVVWLLVKGRAAYALASAPWRTSAPQDGFPSNTHWTEHFSYNELGTPELDQDFDTYLRTARLLEYVRSQRDLPVLAHIEGVNRTLPTAAVTLSLTPLPGQSVDALAAVLATTLTEVAKSQGKDWSWEPSVVGNQVVTLIPLPMLGL